MARELKTSITAQDKTGKAFDALNANLQKSEQKSRSLMERWRDFTIVSNDIANKLRAVGRALGDMMQAADRQQAAELRLALAFRNTGRAVEENTDAMKAWASERQSLTRWGDEVSLELATLGVTLGNLAGRDLQRAIEASQDFAEGTGKGATEAMQLLSRAAAGSDAQFSRMGITLDSSLQGMEKFYAAIEVIEQRFGGMSQVMAQTTAGPLRQFSNAWGDLQEKFGLIIGETKVFRGILKMLIEAVGDLANQNGIIEWAKKVDDILFHVADTALVVVEAILRLLGNITALAEGAALALSRIGINASDAAVNMGNLASQFDGAAASVDGARQQLAEFFAAMDYKGSAGGFLDKLLGPFKNPQEVVNELPTTEEFVAALMGDQAIWEQMGAQYGSVFVSGMVDAFDESIEPSKAFSDMGKNAKDTFVAQMSGEAWAPINQSIGELASALASPFRLVGKVIDKLLIDPIVDFVSGAMKAVTGWMSEMLGMSVAQQAQSAAAAAQTIAMWGPIKGITASAAVAAAIASFGSALAFGPQALAMVEAAGLTGAIPAEEGGLFLHKPGTGGTLVTLAEREPELVVPLSKLDELTGGGGPGVTIAGLTINVSGAATNEETADVILAAIMERLEDARLGGRI